MSDTGLPGTASTKRRGLTRRGWTGRRARSARGPRGCARALRYPRRQRRFHFDAKVAERLLMRARLLRFGEVEIDGRTFDHDVVVEASRISRRHKKASKAFRDRYGHTPLSLAEQIPWAATLIVGTGAEGALPVMDEVREEAERRGVRLAVMPTREACRLLSASDPRTTAAILHVTC